jgi:hypothetical protein
MKRDLQVSKKGNWLKQKGNKKWAGKKEMLLNEPAYVHSVTYTLSANNDVLCLGYK